MTKHSSTFRIPVIISFLFPVMLVFSWILLFFMGSVVLDPDFGWHLRIGEYIVNHGVPGTDPFSYTMPLYPYVDNEWLLNVILHYVYPVLGMTGLSVIFASIAIFILVIVIPRSQYIYALVPGMFVVSVMLTRFAVRLQVVSWLYFALLIHATASPRAWKLWRVFMPPLFLLWGNTHGSFPLGLGFVAIYIAVTGFLRKRVDITDVIILVLSFGTTFITPYGGRIWGEVWMTISDRNLHERILEWFPTYTRPEFGTFAAVAFIVLILIKFRHLVSMQQRILLCASAVLAFMSLRHVPFFILLSVPVILQWFASMHKTVRSVPEGEKRFWIFYVLLCFVSVGFLIIDITHTAGSGYNRSQTYVYPDLAIRYLKETSPEGNIFTLYGWGGYMLWKLPEKKVFIDGRMPSFRMQTPEGGKMSAMDLYLQVLEGYDAQKIFDAYDINLILLPVQRKQSSSVADIVYKLRIMDSKDIHVLREVLKRDPWKVVYQDNQAVVYQRDYRRD